MPSHGGRFAGRVMAGFASEDEYTGFEEDSSEEESIEEIPKPLYVSPESFDDESLF